MPTSPRAASVRLLGLLSLLLGLLFVAQPGAYAGSRTVRDGSDDAYSIAGETPTRQPGAKGDISTVTTAHRRAKVTVRVKLRDLPAGTNMLILEVKTAKPGKPFFVTALQGDGLKMVSLTKGMNSVDTIRCKGFRVAVQPGQDLIRAEIPRTCIGEPRWVRTAAAVVTAESMDDLDSADSTGTVDVAGMSTLSAKFLNSDTAKLPLGPKVRVG